MNGVCSTETDQASERLAKHGSCRTYLCRIQTSSRPDSQGTMRLPSSTILYCITNTNVQDRLGFPDISHDLQRLLSLTSKKHEMIHSRGYSVRTEQGKLYLNIHGFDLTNKAVNTAQRYTSLSGGKFRVSVGLFTDSNHRHQHHKQMTGNKDHTFGN